MASTHRRQRQKQRNAQKRGGQARKRDGGSPQRHPRPPAQPSQHGARGSDESPRPRGAEKATPKSRGGVSGLLSGFLPTPKDSRGDSRNPRQVVGVLRIKATGFGFVLPLDSGVGDVFLPAQEARHAFDGDLVRVEVVPGRGGRSAGRFLDCLERRRTHCLGVYRAAGRLARVEPLDPAIPGPLHCAQFPKARAGQVVRVRLLPGVSPENGPLAEVEAVLGDEVTPGLEALSAGYAAGFDDSFPGDVLVAAEALPARVGAAEFTGRRDLTGLPLCTIDGEDARDFDDAVYVEALGTGHRLVVAIADVAHYVRPGSPLDAEALRRGTSLYLPDRVLPMLPERLSNDLCSLVPFQTRLCLVADLVIDGEGQTRQAELYPAVMRSAARCTYDQVASSLAGAKVDLPEAVVSRFPTMAALADRLSKMRRARGALDFNLPEGKIVLGPNGEVVDVVRRPRNAAHRLIEECMLAANEAVARAFADRGLPTVYRVHGQPDAEKLMAFAALARAHGFELDAGEEIRPQALDAFLRRSEGRPEERALNNLLLRAMMQALYSSRNQGHYGLGARSYLHFTSPIRRYPDLMVHRLLWSDWSGSATGPLDEDTLEAVARRCSERERAAMSVEREVDSYYAALLMRDHVGEEFEGTIDGAMSAGLFVELDRYMVSGLVRAEELGDEAELDDTHQRWFLRRTGKSFRIGEKLKVVVASVNLARRQIDLALAEPVPGGPKKVARPGGPQRRPQGQSHGKKDKSQRGGQRRRR